MSRRQRGASQQAAGAGGAALLSAALQQEVLGLTGRLLEEVARAVGERVRQEVERETRALREKVTRMEEQMAALQANEESRVQSMGDRMSNGQAARSLEEREQQAEHPQAEREVTAELSGRMARVEASLQRALTTVMPKVEALLAQLEATRTAAASPAPAASNAPASASSSSAPPPAGPRAPSPATRQRLEEDLYRAVGEGWEERVRELLDAGADVDARDHKRMTPLHHAALYGRADAGAKDASGWTALHYDAQDKSTGPCASLLLDAGAEVDSATHDGRTPLHYAAWNSNKAAVRVLLAAGADRTARDTEGETPLDFAESRAVRRLLRG